ncbi:hypothetical protein KFZ76_13710 [Methylovulum psychrotolerans]|uniref:hypothetical protein n=1 Tax=Methylovulum psychrotolerans TaxID=1704499 RepID=UPI001BFEF733|nr:hypothetical protein [Methylovulum psychrotolerans]MBT9098761.1 hypothetical protein [Methylovulum psychrotolerans]
MEAKKTRAKGGGRKPLPIEDRAKNVSVRLTPAQYEKFLTLGGIAWLRHQIEIAEPTD